MIEPPYRDHTGSVVWIGVSHTLGPGYDDNFSVHACPACIKRDSTAINLDLNRWKIGVGTVKSKYIPYAKNKESSSDTEALLLSPREAARALSICEKTLWTITQKGEIPVIKIGRLVRYPIEGLKAWIENKSQNNT